MKTNLPGATNREMRMHLERQAISLGLPLAPGEFDDQLERRVIAAQDAAELSEDKKAPEAAGLPVLGYKATQPPEAIAAVNRFNELEERVLRHIDSLLKGKSVNDPDARWLAIGRTQIELGFMAANRAIFKPGRVALPDDDQTSLSL